MEQEIIDQIETECTFTNGSLHDLELLFRIKITELEQRITELENGI